MVNTHKQKAFVGMDMHRDSIYVTVLPECQSQPLFEKKLPNNDKKVKRLLDKIAREYHVQAAYEAGNCGFGLCRQMRAWGYKAQVLAPNNIPRSTSNKKRKNDRRDSLNIARLLQRGQAEGIKVPDEIWESHRAVLRARYTLGEQLSKIKTRVVMTLHCRGYVYREGKNWTGKFRRWIRKIELLPHDRMVIDHYLNQITFMEVQKETLDEEIEKLSQMETYQQLVTYISAIRGMSVFSSLLVLLEIIDFRRFRSPKQLMGFVGLIPCEHSSGNRMIQGHITKEGNERVRKVLAEAAWCYARQPRTSKYIARKYQHLPADVIKIALKADKRLHKKFYRLILTGHSKQKAIIAVARELVGFVWAMAMLAADH